ncbi:MAG: DUF1566 domain-containing protein [Nitrospirota bacterium]|nr:DUF1566 domain-containing protein [Nitrospirota bacterium]
MKKRHFGFFAALVLCLSLIAAACGGGGGGGIPSAATLTSIAVTPATPSIALGTTQQFAATGTFSDGSTQNLTTQVGWSSSDTGKATINSAGLATSVAVGTTTVTATSGNIVGTATLTVTNATLASIAVTPATASIATGATQQFTARGTYSDGSAKDITASVTWASSDVTRATVSAAGLATAASNAAGSTTITATSGSVSGSAVLKIIVNLPKTGQVTSYGTGSIDDGALQRGVAWPTPRFTAGTGAEVDCVTDNLTGLMWVKAPDSTITRTWQEALDYANGLDLCGHTDWRLPNKKELRSLANYGEADVATWLNNQGFSNVQASFYWSSTTYAGLTTLAGFVSMFNGLMGYDTKGGSYYAWPVRSGQ